MADLNEILNLSSVKTDEGRRQLDASMANLLSSDIGVNNKKKFEASQVVSQLLKRASLDIREMLAERLAVQEDVPVQLLLALAHDENISVARPIIREANNFTDDDWSYIIDETSTEHWQEIAKKDNLSTPVVHKLIDKRDEDTCVVIIQNKTLTFDREAMQKLKQVAFRVESLHSPLLDRHEIDMKMAAELYWSASYELRSQIIEKYSIDKKAVDRVLEDVVQEMINASSGHHDVTEDLILLAQRYGERREVTTQFMTKALRRGQIAFFIALLAEYCQVSVNIVKQCLTQQDGDAMASLCKSQGVMKSDFASFFLMTRDYANQSNEGKKEGKVNQTDLAGALDSYEIVKKDAAMQLLEQWRDNPDMQIA